MNGLLGGAFLSVAGILTGLAWRMPWIGNLDQRLFERVNSAPWPSMADAVLRGIRLLGTKWVVFGVTLVLLIWEPRFGLALAASALASGGLERLVKLTVRRARPFAALAGVRIRQDRPLDASFPSGDATRAWLLFAFLTSAFSPSWPIWVGAGVLAGAASLGRVRVGVHYPLDVWSGGCLGAGVGLAGSAILHQLVGPAGMFVSSW